MQAPLVGEPFAASEDIHVIPTYWPVPGVGVLPMNAFVIHAEEPVLVDTGAAVLSDQFLDALSSVIDPGALRWIWITHEDRDHTGSLQRLLDLAPRATVLTSFMALGRMMNEIAVPFDRLRLVNPGETVNVGDRNLTAIRPPLFDSPATTGFLDDRSGALFASDCFGAPLPTYDEAAVRDIGELAEETVTGGQLAWAHVDSPWVATVDQQRFAASVDRVRQLAPSTILSSHLPPARGRTDQLAKALASAPTAPPVPGVTQAELEALLASLEPA